MGLSVRRDRRDGGCDLHIPWRWSPNELEGLAGGLALICNAQAGVADILGHLRLGWIESRVVEYQLSGFVVGRGGWSFEANWIADRCIIRICECQLNGARLLQPLARKLGCGNGNQVIASPTDHRIQAINGDGRPDAIWIEVHTTNIDLIRAVYNHGIWIDVENLRAGRDDGSLGIFIHKFK